MADAPKQNIEVYLDPSGAVQYQWTDKAVGTYPHTRVFENITVAKIATGKLVAAKRKVWSDLGVWVKQSSLSDVLPAAS